jgi:hypothetical protein
MDFAGFRRTLFDAQDDAADGDFAGAGGPCA